jgi:hypothetical protein
MKRTHWYLTGSTLAGSDPAAGLAWLARRGAWDRRLETLEAGRGDEAGAGRSKAARRPEPAR